MQSITKKIFINTAFCSTLGWRFRNGKIRTEFSPGELFRMEQGKEVHKIARTLYPDGIFVNELGSPLASTCTSELLASLDSHVIFEATFLAGNYIAKADILVRDEGSWELIEVKSSINAKDEFIDDLAYTTLVAQTAGFSPSAISLLLIDKNYRYGMPCSHLFVKTDMTAQVLARVEEFKTIADLIDSVSSSPDEPEPQLTYNCKQCGQFGKCLGKEMETHIFEIPGIRQKAIDQLIALGITSIHHIPDDFSLKDNQKLVVDCVKCGKMKIDPDLHKKLATIRWPAFTSTLKQ